MSHHKLSKEKINIPGKEGSSTLNKEEQEVVDLIEDLPHSQKEDVMEHLALSVSSKFSGPLPPPDVLEGYENCSPGAADRIITMAEKEQNHRLNKDDEILKVYERCENKGMNFAFIVTMSFLVFGAVLIYLGKSMEGFGILTPVIVQFFIHVFKSFKENNKTEIENVDDATEDLD